MTLTRSAVPARRWPAGADVTPPAAGLLAIFAAEMQARAFEIGCCSTVLVLYALVGLLTPGGTA